MSAENTFDGPWWAFPVMRNALLAGLVAGTAFALGHLDLIPSWVETTLYIIAIPIGGGHWAREGLEKLARDKEVGIEILMLGATIGSGLLGMWDEAAALVFLYGAAEGLEEYTYARTRNAIRALLDLAPKEARVVRNGAEVTIAAEELKPGDVFVVRPGETIPTDGWIQSGTSTVDESPVTGESSPVDKAPGMKVFAATMNRQGALSVTATAAFADNTLSKIIHLVEEAQEQKGRAQQWIERFGRRYSPAVLGASLLLLLLPLLLDVSWEEWSRRAVVLLVAGAPCALIMSTPVAMAAGIGAAGKRGILIKGGAHLENLGRIKVVAFDKTGTLTKGKPAVVDVIPTEGTVSNLLSLAAGLEHYSEHPLAHAIVERAEADGIAAAETRDFQSLTGAGAQAVVGDEKWFIGSPDLFAKLGLKLDELSETVYRLQAEGKTVVLLGTMDRSIGLLALQDQVRDTASAVVKALQARSIRTVMLTGDNSRTAKSIAASLGIDDVRADLKPQDKVAAVRQLEAEYGPVLMVGDGVNDAPALAAATCGVAMGAAGSDAAVETADVALMADDLTKVVDALALGLRARRVSTQNIVFSITLLIFLVPMALAGILSVAATVLTHELAELIAVGNGLRVRTAVPK